jgi:hypothetical protein
VIGKLKELGVWSSQGSPFDPSVKWETGKQSLTLEELAEAKKLPIELLQKLGVSNFRYMGQPAVRIPYRLSSGDEVSVHFRLALHGDDRFRWRKGDHAFIYGLDRLDNAKKHGWVLLVEGESDCWTGWQFGLPVIGIPGKSAWHNVWKERFADLDVFLWQEPEAEDLSERVGRDIPNLKVIIAPQGTKDISEAHIQGKDVPAFVEELKKSAIPFKQMLDEKKEVEQATMLKRAAKVAQSDDPLKLIEQAIRDLGFGGDIRPAMIIYLAATSRLLAMQPGTMPVHTLLLGPTSCGKSYTLQTVLKLLPADTVSNYEAGSPRALIYDNTDIKHKVVVFGEADSLPAGEDNPAASAVRNLLQDHCLRYKVSVKSESGGYEVKEINREGPAVLITTSTRRLGSQLDSRVFTLEIADDSAQIKAALATQASIEISGVAKPDEALVSYQAFLQIRAPIDVVVPFAPRLAELVGKAASAHRIHRDYSRLLSLIKSVAVLRHNQRSSANGRLVAQIADYETVFNLVGPIYEASVGASKIVREVVEAVSSMEAAKIEGITATKVAKRLDIGKGAALGRIKTAVSEGWLINTEARKGHPWALKVGEEMPGSSGLPTPKELNKSGNDSAADEFSYLLSDLAKPTVTAVV